MTECPPVVTLLYWYVDEYFNPQFFSILKQLEKYDFCISEHYVMVNMVEKSYVIQKPSAAVYDFAQTIDRGETRPELICDHD